MFGEDSDEEEEQEVVAKTNLVIADTSGLFGSDSSSDEEDEGKPRMLQKQAASASATAHETTKKKRIKLTDDDPDDTKDAYDSGDEVVKSKEDADFIDGDDDLADVLGEYDNERQEFNDDRPIGRDDFEEDAPRNLQEENFFDETMNSLKTGRKRKGLSLSPQELEQLVQEILYRMDTAQNADETSLSEGRPGLEKLKLLDTVIDVLSKVSLQSILLDFNLLEVMRKWIQPNGKGKLPNVGIRTKLLRVTKRLPVFKDHLRRSGFGKVVMALYKHPDETNENKDVCRELIERWSRSVFDKSMDYKRLAEYEAEKESRSFGRNTQSAKKQRQNTAAHIQSAKQVLKGKAASAVPVSYSDRVRVPQQIQLDFQHRPEPKFETVQAAEQQNVKSKKLDPDSRKGRLVKRMTNLARPVKKSKAAISMSIEGRSTK